MTAAEKTTDRKTALWQILGPLFIFTAYALAPHNALLFCVGLTGLFFCEMKQMRGLNFALPLLIAASFIEHMWLTSSHVWQAGLELSYGIAFFITAYHAEERVTSLQSLSTKATIQQSSLENLEQELQQFQQESASQKMLSSEKIASLQKELDEGRAEFASLEILNEVLRKTTERAHQERALALQTLATLQHRLDFLSQQITKEENPSEMQELLNQARLDREQAHLISETMARLHARENFRARTLEEKVQALQEANSELPAADLAHLQEKVKALTAVETLYKQLRAQFAEKNETLHETRAVLFRTDTQLQTLQLEKEQRELHFDPVPKEVQRELSLLEKERAALEEENRTLQELITHLMESSPSQKKK